MVRHELKYMEAAIAVAEELSFSRAAKRLHLSQPAVTKYIAELEEMLGVILFMRDHHVVTLTEAGRVYVEEARIGVLHGERAVQAARSAGRDSELTLNIGRSPYADPYFTSTLLATRLPLYPRLRLNMSSGFSCDLTRDILSGELDLALVIEPPLSDLLTSVTIDESPLYVVMSKEDELASHPFISFHQLANKHWILFQRQTHPPLYDLIQKLSEQQKILPSAIQHFMIPEDAIPLMGSCGTVMIVGKSAALRIARDGLTLRPLDEAVLMVSTLLLSRSDNDSKLLSELLRNVMRRLSHLTIDKQLSLPLRLTYHRQPPFIA